MGLYCRFVIMFMYKGKLDDKKMIFFLRILFKIIFIIFYLLVKLIFKIVMGV